jgi:hypothetical protein
MRVVYWHASRVFTLLPVDPVKFVQTMKATVGPTYPNYKLARMLTRLLSRKTYAEPAGATALKLNFVENALGYFELNPAEARVARFWC